MTTRKNKFNSRWLFLLVPLLFAVLGSSAYLLSQPVQWEVTRLTTYMRGVISPVGTLTAVEDPPAASHGFLFAPFTAEDQVEAKSASVAQVRLPAQKILPAPAFDPARDYQSWNNCGPATLALTLRMYGWQGDQNTIADVIKPQEMDKNVNIEELKEYVVSTTGLRAEIRYAGDLTLLKSFISAGFPVIVEEAFTLEKSFWPGDDLWTSHFVLLTGYDDKKAVFISQDVYLGPNQELNANQLLEDWKAFNYIYMVVYEPQHETKIKSLLAADWAAKDNIQKAANLAAQQTRQDSGDRLAWFNLGTSLNGLQEYEKAWQAFNEARKLGLPQRMLRYQFGPFLAAYETGRTQDLSSLVTYALKVTSNSEEVLVWQGKLFLMQKEPDRARQAFIEALSFHPLYSDALDGLRHLR